MLKVLRLVFEAFCRTRLTLKPNKCTFGVQQFKYLGFRILQGVI